MLLFARNGLEEVGGEGDLGAGVHGVLRSAIGTNMIR